MSAKLNQPVGQKLLTNIAVVRLKKGGQQFQIACYPNKVMPWREGVEKDLAEVLQVDAVFTNVTSGKIANRAQLDKAFGAGVPSGEIVLEILKKGQLQTTQAERAKQSESAMRDIATIVADKCVNADTNRPFTVAVIETAMRDDLHYNLHPTRSAKQQALAVIALLKKHIPIERAHMRLHVSLPEKLAAKLKDRLKLLFASVESEDWSADYELTGLIDPGRFRAVEELLAAEAKGKARVEVLDFSVIREGSAKIVDETRRTDADAAAKAADDDDNDDEEEEEEQEGEAGDDNAAAADDNDDDDDESSGDAPPRRAAAPAVAAKQKRAAAPVKGGLSKDEKYAKRVEKTERQKERRTAHDKKRGGGNSRRGEDERDGLPNEDDISL